VIFLVSEDIADNWILLDLDVLRKEVESKGGKWNVDGYCKGFINNPNIKLPLASGFYNKALAVVTLFC